MKRLFLTGYPWNLLFVLHLQLLHCIPGPLQFLHAPETCYTRMDLKPILQIHLQKNTTVGAFAFDYDAHLIPSRLEFLYLALIDPNTSTVAHAGTCRHLSTFRGQRCFLCFWNPKWVALLHPVGCWKFTSAYYGRSNPPKCSSASRLATACFSAISRRKPSSSCSPESWVGRMPGLMMSSVSVHHGNYVFLVVVSCCLFLSSTWHQKTQKNINIEMLTWCRWNWWFAKRCFTT